MFRAVGQWGIRQLERSRKGSFDTLRLVAAMMVFHSHSFALAGLREPFFTGFSLGGIAVVMFFAMSGYWVTRSALDRSLASYAASRALRIAPGLFVCCLVTIAICALATSDIVNDYLRNRDTWRWLGNTFPFFVPQRGTLPGVFEDGAFHNPNGSLWTLPYEVLCYLIAGLAALFGPKGMRVTLAGAAIFVGATLFGPQQIEPVRLLSPLERQYLALFGGAFFFGAALNGMKDRDLAKLVAVGAVGVLVGLPDQNVVRLAAVVMYGGLVVWLGRNLNVDRVITRGRDVSYGIYIYAYPCEQLAVRALPPHHLAGYALYYAVALAGTAVLAVLSWELVEKPALRLKARAAGLFESGVGRLSPRSVRVAQQAEA
jgi:peptidoglycan/LPS O-acetylase OafA/YrhL